MAGSIELQDEDESRQPATGAGLSELSHSGAGMRWTIAAGRIWHAALDVVFPIDCLGCGSRGRFICPTCVARMPTLDRPFCTVCANPGVSGTCSWCQAHAPAIDAIRSPFLYVPSSPVHRAITMLKYRGMRSIAPEMADLLHSYLASRRSGSPDIVVPVPSHASRVRQRGYAQAALIATELGAKMKLPVGTHALVRVNNAPSQLETESREGRWANVQGGFECSSSLEGANVLLVDDLVTTGSTASACASALKRAGARRVIGLSVARAP